MSDTSINTFLSSASYDSPTYLNSEEVQFPFLNNKSPISQQSLSQDAKEVSNTTNNLPNIISCQQFAVQTFLCPHNIVTTCFCCSQQGLQRDEDPELKSSEKLYHDSLVKAQALEGSLGDFKEEILKMQKKVEDVISPIKEKLATWFEENTKKLEMINQKIQQDLADVQQKLLKNDAFNLDTEHIESHIKVLKGDFQNWRELDNAHSQEELFQSEIKEKIKVMKKLSDSLRVPDLSDLSAKLKDIVLFHEKAVKKIRIPSFVNEKLYETAMLQL